MRFTSTLLVALRALRRNILRSVLTALKGGIPDNVYNKDVLPKWKERFGGASVSQTSSVSQT